MATVKVIIEGSDLNEVEEIMVNFVNSKTSAANTEETPEKENSLGF